MGRWRRISIFFLAVSNESEFQVPQHFHFLYEISVLMPRMNKIGPDKLHPFNVTHVHHIKQKKTKNGKEKKNLQLSWTRPLQYRDN